MTVVQNWLPISASSADNLAAAADRFDSAGSVDRFDSAVLRIVSILRVLRIVSILRVLRIVSILRVLWIVSILGLRIVRFCGLCGSFRFCGFCGSLLSQENATETTLRKPNHSRRGGYQQPGRTYYNTGRRILNATDNKTAGSRPRFGGGAGESCRRTGAAGRGSGARLHAARPPTARPTPSARTCRVAWVVLGVVPEGVHRWLNGRMQLAP